MIGGFYVSFFAIAISWDEVWLLWVVAKRETDLQKFFMQFLQKVAQLMNFKGLKYLLITLPERYGKANVGSFRKLALLQT